LFSLLFAKVKFVVISLAADDDSGHDGSEMMDAVQ
jgi:hypothetical protein